MTTKQRKPTFSNQRKLSNNSNNASSISNMAAQLPQLSHVLETILYTRNIDNAREFYGTLLGLNPIRSITTQRSAGYMLGQTNLLIFALGKTTEDLILDPERPENVIPKHGPTEEVLETLMVDSRTSKEPPTTSLRQHYCFAVNTIDEVKQWERYLVEKEVAIPGRMDWKEGSAYSVYFTDPDGHVGEIASRGLWPNW
jgi:catechol 2,3-dioxygenase-like lactoylglutathione lyase family enzyme